MAGNDTVKSQSITNLDASPIVPNTAAQGAAGRVITVGDFCAATAAGLNSAGSWYKICRIPTGAIPISVTLATDGKSDTGGAAALALDLNLIFSDAAVPSFDGTPSFLQGLIPTTANTGGTTTIASYSSPNKIFGTVKPANTGAFGPTDEIFNGLGANYSFNGLTNQPLWQTFGFTDGRGNPADPGGYFDLLVYVATGAQTGVACNIYARVTYVI